MKRMSTDDVKEQILELIDQLNEDTVTITKDGNPVAMLTKYADFESDSSDLIGSLKDRITVNGDIFSTGVHYPEDCHKYNRDKDQS